MVVKTAVKTAGCWAVRLVAEKAAQ
jgi:hypothetical protein